MGRIIDLILKNRNFLVFLLFAFISLRLVFTYNYHHQNSFLKASSFFIQSMTDRTANLNNYFNLKEENNDLRLELTKTKMRLEQYQLQTQVEQTVQIDTVRGRQYVFQPARLVSKNVKYKKNFLTLNKGSLSGVKVNDGVITSTNKVVGKIVDVSEHFSLVMPVIHDELKVRVSLKNTDLDGILSWTGGSLKTAEVIEMGKRAPVSIGDTIQCSSNSLFFPPGVHVGQISEFKVDGDVLDLKIELSTDFLNLGHVLIVSNQLLEEQLELETNDKFDNQE